MSIVNMADTTDPRILFAAERTLLAWQRNAIALMGFGFVVERFGLFLQMITHQANSGSQRIFSLWLGVALLTLGAIVALVSARHFHQVAQHFDDKVAPRRHRLYLGVTMNIVIALVGLLLAVHFLWRSH